MISREEVLHIAKLSRLHITEAEAGLYGSQLSTILDYVSKLQSVNVADVPPVAQVTGLEHAVRKDRVMPSDAETREALLNAAPRRKGDYIETRGVFDS